MLHASALVLWMVAMTAGVGHLDEDGAAAPPTDAAPTTEPAPTPAPPLTPPPPPPSSPPGDGRCSMAVLDFSPKGVAADGAKVFVDALALALEEGSGCRVLSAADMRSMVEFEALRETMGCDEAAASCLAELGGALGVGHVITGELVDLGDGSVAITARRVAIQAGQVDGRANITAPSGLAALREAGPRAAAVLLGKDDPGAVVVEAEASVLPMVALGAGAAAAVVGGVLVAVGETTLSTASAKSADKDTALLVSRAGVVVVAAGVVVAGVGAALWMVGE